MSIAWVRHVALFEDGWAQSAWIYQARLLQIVDISPSLSLSRGLCMSLWWNLIGAVAGLRVDRGGLPFSDLRGDMIFQVLFFSAGPVVWLGER